MAKTHGRKVVLFIVESGGSTFTELVNLTGDITAQIMHDAVDSSGHNQGLQSFVVDPMLKTPSWALEGNLDVSESSHDEITGIMGLVKDGVDTAVQLRGGAFVAPDTDVVEASGQFISHTWTGPVEGVYKFAAVFQPGAAAVPFLKINADVQPL